MESGSSTFPPGPGDSAAPGLTPADERLWDRFRAELWSHEAWDHEFIGSPHDPARPLRAFVDHAGAAAAPTLVGALSAKDDTWTYWACVGLEWLGPLAGVDAAAALEARVGSDKEPYWPAAVALEAVDPARARAAGVQRERGVMDHLVRFHLETGIEPACEFIEWIVDHEDAATIREMLGNWELQSALVKRCPPQLAARLRLLAESHSSVEVRAPASRLLAEMHADDDAAELIRMLARSGGISVAAVERLAAYPDSVLLVKPVVEMANLYLLSDLLLRRRCAGWQTDPAPIRPLLREKLEHPTREWRYEEHDVHNAALCVAELQDLGIIDSLVKAVAPENCGYAWGPLVQAFRTLGAPAEAALRSELAACLPGERRERLEWMLAAIEQKNWGLQERLAHADEVILRGRIEPTIGGAFRAYADVLLDAPSTHAAFQLAWIDRAFGAEVVAERLTWIRSLGFRDEELLALLAQPVEKPLTGHRSQWDPGEFLKDADRAERAAEVGLPSLAGAWSRPEQYAGLAEEQLARVRRAVHPTS